MDNVNMFYIVCGFLTGYTVFNIIDIIKTNIRMKEVNHLLEDREDKVKALKIDINETNPLVVVYNTLLLDFPESKVQLHNNDNAITICYGHSCVVTIDKHSEHSISIGIGVDKTTEQSEEDSSAEFNELRELLESCNFSETNLTRALAHLVAKLQRVELTKYSKVSRQIPHDML